MVWRIARKQPIYYWWPLLAVLLIISCMTWRNWKLMRKSKVCSSSVLASTFVRFRISETQTHPESVVLVLFRPWRTSKPLKITKFWFPLFPVGKLSFFLPKPIGLFYHYRGVTNRVVTNLHTVCGLPYISWNRTKNRPIEVKPRAQRLCILNLVDFTRDQTMNTVRLSKV